MNGVKTWHMIDSFVRHHVAGCLSRTEVAFQLPVVTMLYCNIKKYFQLFTIQTQFHLPDCRF